MNLLMTLRWWFMTHNIFVLHTFYFLFLWGNNNGLRLLWLLTLCIEFLNFICVQIWSFRFDLLLHLMWFLWLYFLYRIWPSRLYFLLTFHDKVASRDWFYWLLLYFININHFIHLWPYWFCYLGLLIDY